MRAISIQQCWAWAVMHGGKRYENRGWSTPYVGPLVIHAGKNRQRLRASRDFCDRLGLWVPANDKLPFGALVGLVDMLDCLPATSIPKSERDAFVEGPFCHVYANPRPFAKPLDWSGSLGFFQVPDAMVEQLLAAA